MKADWTPLDTELRHWAGAGLTLPLWWRDDDAVAATAALDQLAVVSERAGVPVHLAVVPAGAGADLADWLVAHDTFIPMVHGWAHINHAPEGEKKAEFGAHRPLPERLDDARRGRAVLTVLLGRAPAPVFVPPWNRIAPDMAAGLSELGYAALSTFGPRDHAGAAPGLARINTHLDLIDWRGTRSLVDPQTLIARITRHLADRRTGSADNGEPYGILTHHLVHDAAIWSFLTTLLTRLTAGPIALWTADALPTKTRQKS